MKKKSRNGLRKKELMKRWKHCAHLLNKFRKHPSVRRFLQLVWHFVWLVVRLAFYEWLDSVMED